MKRMITLDGAQEKAAGGFCARRWSLSMITGQPFEIIGIPRRWSR